LAKVAFLGLGVMGYPMAGHLKAGGHDVTVYNRTAAKADKWVAEYEGVKADTPADAAKGCDFVFACVGDDKDIASVTTGPDGAFKTMPADAVFIDNTTASADIARVLYDAARTRGLHFIDAPVSGGVARAITGELIIMVGGNEVTVNKVGKILNVMGSVKRAGPLGSGHAMKSLNNYVSAAGLIASFEALNTAKKYGIESKDFIAIINGATGKNNTTEVKLEKFVVSEKFNSGFALDLMIKDVSIADQLIKKMSSDNPLSKQVLEYLEKSYKIVGKNSDHTEVFKVLKN